MPPRPAQQQRLRLRRQPPSPWQPLSSPSPASPGASALRPRPQRRRGAPRTRRRRTQQNVRLRRRLTPWTRAEYARLRAALRTAAPGAPDADASLLELRLLRDEVARLRAENAALAPALRSGGLAAAAAVAAAAAAATAAAPDAHAAADAEVAGVAWHDARGQRGVVCVLAARHQPRAAARLVAAPLSSHGFAAASAAAARGGAARRRRRRRRARRGAGGGCARRGARHARCKRRVAARGACGGGVPPARRAGGLRGACAWPARWGPAQRAASCEGGAKTHAGGQQRGCVVGWSIKQSRSSNQRCTLPRAVRARGTPRPRAA
jgi:hypothetical protein